MWSEVRLSDIFDDTNHEIKCELSCLSFDGKCFHDVAYHRKCCSGKEQFETSKYHIPYQEIENEKF